MPIKLQVLTTKQIFRTPPDPQGWESCWSGYFQMTKVRSAHKREMDRRVQGEDVSPADVMSDWEAERQFFLNVVQDIKKDCITMFELGAGRGDICLSLAGVIDFHLVPVSAKFYRCLALEAEPTHFEWTKEHLERQGIKGVVVHGAIHGYDGYCQFDTNEEHTYGSSIYSMNVNITVPCYTIDTLMKKYDFPHIDILHMDVQGAECVALQGAGLALSRGNIDYIIIATHDSGMNGTLRKFLNRNYEIIIDISPGTPQVETSIGKVSFPEDGLMIFKRRALDSDSIA